MSRVGGKCKWFNSKKGYGFLTLDSGEDVFVHQSEIHAVGFRSLAENERVECEVIMEDDKKKAIRVTGPHGEYVKGADVKFRQPMEQFQSFPRQQYHGSRFD
ncbi:bifunctional Cold-shock protein [Babesia duncani]|uniref:Bifunctional Cold-shock protein n=1 Tax=Babesia duncani TaxID=323732 RepID=A0AAD9UNV0_9APIC|nr:bifunctional Cold-shock protein [Babesia duncani]